MPAAFHGVGGIKIETFKIPRSWISMSGGNTSSL